MTKNVNINESSFPGLSEEAIVKKAQSGDERALNHLFKIYEGFVKSRARAYYLIGAEGDDIIQEGMIGFYKAIRDFRDDKQASFKAFSELCITRQIITAIKAATRQKHAPLNSYVSFDKPIFDDGSEHLFVDTLSMDIKSDPQDVFIDKEGYQAIEQMIGVLLSKLEKEVLYRYLQGESYENIASEIERPVKSIDNAVQRIRRKFAKSLKNSNGK